MSNNKDDIEAIIIDNIMSDINSGKYKIKDKLPSENELVDIYKVPRTIIRKAYERLEQIGYNFKIMFFSPYPKHFTIISTFLGLIAVQNLVLKWVGNIVKGFVSFIRAVPTVL